jgi:phthalate 4,5-dioxygenase reductase subunit
VSAAVEFEVEIASSGAVVPVHRGQSMLQALRDHGLDMASSCEAGTCGTCRTRYLAGAPDHQDFVLEPAEQEEFVMPCVSRATGRIKLAL